MPISRRLRFAESAWLALLVWGVAGEARLQEAPPKKDEPLGVSASLATTLELQSAVSQRTLLMVSTVSYQLGRQTAAFLRLGLVHDAMSGAPTAWGLANPALGGSYGIALGRDLNLTLLAGLTIPVGTGGGANPDPSILRAMLVATDWGGPMFAPDHLDLFPGARLTWTAGPLALRARSTLHQAFRVRGENVDPIGASVTFTTSGLMAGYRPARRALFFAELAQTRFWSTPGFIATDPALRSDHYLAGGLSWTVDPGPRPFDATLMYVRALDAPKRRRSFQLIELELAVQF